VTYRGRRPEMGDGKERRASGRRTAVRAVVMQAIRSGLGERLKRDKFSSMRR
jgi:hypothetical protein